MAAAKADRWRTPTPLLGEESPAARPAQPRAGRCGSSAVCLAALARRRSRRCSCCARARQRLQPDRAVLLRRWRWSPSAAPMPCSPMSRRQAVETYGWLQPGEMLDGLGMAETTPGPLIMVLQFVGFLAAFRDPGALDPLLAGTLGGAPHHLGHVRAVLPLDLPRRALHRAPARTTGADGALAPITAAVVGVILNLASGSRSTSSSARSR